MIRGRNLVLLAIFLIFIVCNLLFENAKANNEPNYEPFTKEIACSERLASANMEKGGEGMYINVSYPCDKSIAFFSLPNYARNYTVKGMVNYLGVLSLTVTPYNSKSILVIIIRSSDKPFDDTPELVKRNLNNFLQDYYPIQTFSYNRQIDSCSGMMLKGTTEDPGRNVFAAIYDPLCNNSKTFRRVLIKTLLNDRDFDELVKTFRVQDERCD